MNIRKADKSNLEIIKELYWELDLDAIKYQPEHFQLLPREDEFLLKIIDEDTSDFLLAEVDGEVVGFALVMMKQTGNISCLKQQRYLYILDFVITEKKRCLGYGTALLNACKEYGRNATADFLRLSVFPFNKDGIRFYEKSGLSNAMLTMECLL